MEISFDRSEVLGKGGYGTVYRGLWGVQPVAVKRIELKSDEQEEKSLQRLDHENVIKLFHAESDENFRYYALELCEASLDKLFLPDGDSKIYMGPIPSPEDVLRQMAIGLAYIHDMGLAHRDVKPENVLISSTNDVVRMKWADFGLSKAVNKKGSYVMREVQGTKKWLAPELLESSSETTLSRRERSTFKSDVFAEGSVFAYFLSDGKHPFGTKRSEISANVLKNNPVNIISIPSLQAQQLITKMLAKNPEVRINSSDVVKELKVINDQLKNDLKYVDSMVSSVNQTKKLLGKGGFTKGNQEGVWEGVWRRQKVAVKKMMIRDDKNLCHEREESLLKLNHPNVIKMFHIESDSDYRYFALELCEASLDKLFLKGDELEKYKGPRLQDMPSPQVVFSQLAEGMAYIHEKGITHRDVKPLNALIHVRKRLEQTHQVVLKWADFGGSKKVNITGECSMSGFKFTPNWCAPEVLKVYEDDSSQSNGITERHGTIQSDVFSQGLVFVYYLLKGESPNGNRFYNKHKLKESDSINLENIPTEYHMFKQLIKKMLKTNPEKRPSSKLVAEKLASSTFVNVSTTLGAASDSPSSPIKTLTMQIERRTILGRGTFGTVFQGSYGNVGPVAIKRIQLDDSNDQEETLTILDHRNNTCENIVKLYHVENDVDFKYFVLELCVASLNQLFLPSKKNGLKPNCFEFMYQLALGLEYIHSKNIVYRDIKPENVLMSVDTTGKKITMKWADFGFTKSKSEQRSGSFSGSGVNQISNWLAPELLHQSYEERTKGNTTMSDIFAEGLLFGYFLSEGQHLFGRTAMIGTTRSSFIPMNIIKNKVNIKIIDSRCCRDIILKMLEPNPNNRITSSQLVTLIQTKQEVLEVRLFALLEETPPNLKKIEIVIREGVNENGLTPLLRLVQKEEGDLLQIIPLLLKRGIDVNHKDEDGWNVLFFLCHHYQEDNMIEIIKLLIEHDINVSCKDKDGKNVLHLLCKKHQKDNLVDIIQLLIERDFDVNLKNKENILHFYCTKYKGEIFIDIVNIFLENGVEVGS